MKYLWCNIVQKAGGAGDILLIVKKHQGLLLRVGYRIRESN